MKKKSQTRFVFFDLFFASRKGMSFVELMAVIAIIGIGASVTIVSLSPAKTQAKLKAAQTELAASIKLAQSYALQGKMAGSSTPKAYGLRTITDETYEIYYCDTTDCSSTITLESFSLASSGVKIDSGKDIYFDIPHGNPSSALSISLNFSGATSKTVTVTSGGSITED